MKIRIQLGSPSKPRPSDRRRLVLLLEGLQLRGIDAELYRVGEPFDVLVTSDRRYKRLLPIVKRGQIEKGIVIHDVVDDVFSSWQSFAVKTSYTGVGIVKWWALAARWGVLQRSLRLGNWGSGPAFWNTCDAIVCSSNVLTTKYLKFNSKVHYIRDPIDPAEYIATPKKHKDGPIVLVWEGGQDNLIVFLPHLDTFRKIIDGGIAKLRIVTDRSRSTPWRGYRDNMLLLKSWGLDVEFVEWTLPDFSHHIASSDVGISPHPPGDPAANAKADTKILGYAYLGLPVIASPIPAYTEALGKADFGFLAETGDEWIDHVQRLAQDYRLRNEMGERGREHVATQATPETFVTTYLELINNVLTPQ